ncbi:centrosomal protein of 128 kDa-like [Schistocerca nitens]|uniref:centrosomal protein of 128 kDa-like n=1 Tax=Schistocerca nitens TaxID=7011 RepID=UPI002117E0B4|nr:centrosomal protein of 128 kDa-like [Schistocerca nitens]
MEKSERFTDLKPQVPGAENPKTSIKNCSSSSLPVFRTPQPPRKLRENSQRSRSQSTGLQHAGKKDSATDTEYIDTQSDDGCFNCDAKRRLRFDSMDRCFTSEKIEELSRELKEYSLSLEVASSQLEINKKNLSSIQNEMTEELSKNKCSLQISQDKRVLNNELELMKETLQPKKIKYQELKNSHDEEYRMLEESHRRLNETFNYLKQRSKKLQCDWESQLLEEQAINSDLSSKVAQKQQMILMLQGELSSLEVEFEDCKAERDKMVSEHNIEKAALLCEYSKNIEKLEKQLEQIESRHSVEKLALEEQLRNLETDCTEYKMAKTSFEAVLSAKEMEVAELIAECEIQKAEYADMKLKHDKDFKILLERLETASQEQDANIQELQMRLQASEKELLQTQSSLEQQAKSYKERISELEDALKKKLEAETKNKIDKCKLAELENTVVELRLKLTTAEDQFNRQLPEYEERALCAERKCCQLEALVGPFRKQLESFLTERGEILRGKAETEDELRYLTLKYAHLLDLQNRKQNHDQKVNYLVQLQEKNMELREEVEKLRSQARAQKATVDKLKSELTASARKEVGTTTAARQILKNRDNSPGKKPPKGKDGGARHVPVGKENSPIHTNFVCSLENSPSDMLPVAMSTPKAFVDRGNNA